MRRYRWHYTCELGVFFHSWCTWETMDFVVYCSIGLSARRAAVHVLFRTSLSYRSHSSLVLTHYSTKLESLVRVNFFRQKVLFWSKKICDGVGLVKVIAFCHLMYVWKVEFWPFFAFPACCARHCSLFRPPASVQLASLESSDPFFTGGSTRKHLMGSGSGCEDSRIPTVIIEKYVKHILSIQENWFTVRKAGQEGNQMMTI